MSRRIIRPMMITAIRLSTCSHSGSPQAPIYSLDSFAVVSVALEYALPHFLKMMSNHRLRQLKLAHLPVTRHDFLVFKSRLYTVEAGTFLRPFEKYIKKNFIFKN